MILTNFKDEQYKLVETCRNCFLTVSICIQTAY